MEQRLNEMLHPEEKLLWVGRPAKEKLLQAADRRLLIVGWVVAAVVGLLILCLGDPHLVSIGHPMSVILVLNGGYFGLALFFSLRPLVDHRTVIGNSLYAVTDQRIIALVKEHELVLMRDSAMPVAVVDGSVCFGNAVDVPARNGRVTAMLGARGEEQELLGVTFYRLPDPAEVMALFTSAEEEAA